MSIRQKIILGKDVWKNIWKLCEKAPDKFARLAVNVWNVSPKNKDIHGIAEAGVDALVEFIKEMELPTSFAQMSIAEDTDLKAVADSTNIITNGCFELLIHEDIYEILKTCLK